VQLTSEEGQRQIAEFERTLRLGNWSNAIKMVRVLIQDQSSVGQEAASYTLEASVLDDDDSDLPELVYADMH